MQLAAIAEAVWNGVLNGFNILFIILVFFLGYVIMEQLRILKYIQGLPGPRFVWPFLGSVMKMVFDPYTFWDEQDKMGPLSWNSIVGNFFLFCQDSSLSRKVLQNASNGSLKMCLNLNGERLLGSNNIAFMQGEKHKNLRKQLLPLFTKKALAKYVSIQEACIRKSIDEWIDLSNNGEKVIEMRPLIRSLNLETSQTVFVGPYLPKEQRDLLANDYALLNDALLSLPWNYPGSKLWKGIRARKRIVGFFETCVKQSKERMRAAHAQGEASGVQPECLLDFWMHEMVPKIDEAERTGQPAPEHSDDHDIACTVLDFLFASQDASSSSLTWMTHLFPRHRDVLERVIEEQRRLRPDGSQPFTLEALQDMAYLRQVVKEVLRYRTPATLAVHTALKDFHLNDNVVVPKGSLVMASLFSSSFQGFTEPHTFDPDRFSEERREDVKYSKNFLVFGAGPHRCLGYEYAILHLLTFASLFATRCDFERIYTPQSEEIVFGPTIYPGDGCLLKLWRREEAAH